MSSYMIFKLHTLITNYTTTQIQPILISFEIFPVITNTDNLCGILTLDIQVHFKGEKTQCNSLHTTVFLTKIH